MNPKVFLLILFGSFLQLAAPLATAQTIYTTHYDNGRSIGTINAATGAGADIGTTGGSSYALACGLDGTLYTTYPDGSGNAQLAIVSRVTGAIVSTIGDLGVPLIALEIDDTGQMWGVGYESQSVNDTFLYRINKETAAITPVGDTGVSFTMDLSFDPAGNLYSTVANSLYQLNLTTGASTLAATITGVPSGGKDAGVMGLMHDTDGTLYATEYVAASPLYEIDPVTGVATVIGSTGFDFPHGGDICPDGLFQINAGMNDAWVSDEAPLQGFFFTVFPGLKYFFLSWFTFDSVIPTGSDTAVFGAFDQRWVTGGGPYSGNSATVTVELTSGGIFNGSVPMATQTPDYGTITITFISCNEAVLTYDFPSLGLSGQMTLARVITDNVALCEALGAP